MSQENVEVVLQGTVRDVRPGPAEGSSPEWLTDVGGMLFFSADDGIHGKELWKAVP